MKRRSVLSGMLSVAAWAVALGVLGLLTADAAGIVYARLQGHAEARPLAERPVSSTKIKLAELPCFKCHSIQRFMKHEEFSHEPHLKEKLHCNRCHTIRGHMVMGLRDKACNACH